MKVCEVLMSYFLKQILHKTYEGMKLIFSGKAKAEEHRVARTHWRSYHYVHDIREA